MSTFDDAVSVTRKAPDRFGAGISEKFNVGPVPNGGYVMSLALNAMLQNFPGREPLTTTMHYLRPSQNGDVEITVETVKEGKRYATAMARLLQGGKETARLLATFGTHDPAPEKKRLVNGKPPELVPPDEGIVVPPNDIFVIGRQFDMRFQPGTVDFMQGKQGDRALIAGYMRFADGREPDVRALPLLCDAMPPPLLNVVPFSWVPTIELTTHVRARPVPGWIRFKFESRFIFDGLLEEDGELWDEAGTLVAQSRQLAQLPNSPT
ncbi:MAG TPA: thioesterase family protein [Polyangiaceae bacterium]